MPPRKPFLTAQWRNLAMLNFEIDPARLAPWVPPGTEIDRYEGAAFVSVVGFTFEETKVCGLALPGHRYFPEVNLRFYVRREVTGELRRGVVFIKEIVPRRLVTAVARSVYGENYITLPMRHALTSLEEGGATTGRRVAYGWRLGGHWQRLELTFAQPLQLPSPGSLEEFIVEHYWGYSRNPPGGALEYEVSHPPWRVAPAETMLWQCDVQKLYGPDFAAALERPPHSALFAEGSDIAVYRAAKVAERLPGPRIA